MAFSKVLITVLGMIVIQMQLALTNERNTNASVSLALLEMDITVKISMSVLLKADELSINVDLMHAASIHLALTNASAFQDLSAKTHSLVSVSLFVSLLVLSRYDNRLIIVEVHNNETILERDVVARGLCALHLYYDATLSDNFV